MPKFGMSYDEALEVLGITQASQAKEAYRRLAKIHHPDVGGTGFERIAEAYATIKQTDKRPAQSTWHCNPFANWRNTASTRSVSVKDLIYLDVVMYLEAEGFHDAAEAVQRKYVSK